MSGVELLLFWAAVASHGPLFCRHPCVWEALGFICRQCGVSRRELLHSGRQAAEVGEGA